MSELYTYKPIRVILSGDKKAAKGLIREGQKHSAELDKNMSFQGLKQGNNTVKKKDYIIEVTTTFNERKIEIYHVPITTEVHEEPEEKKECDCFINFAECEIIGITTDGNNNIPVFGDYDEYCICFDIMVCSYESEGADKDGFVLWERVRPSDFTRYQPGDKAIVVFEELEPETEWVPLPDSTRILVVTSNCCSGFESNQMDPDSSHYLFPVIIPLVTKDEYVEECSYKPFSDGGIVQKDNNIGSWYKLENAFYRPDTLYFLTPGGVRSGLSLFTNQIASYINYPTIDSSQPTGINCSVHWTHSSQLSTGVNICGDTLLGFYSIYPYTYATEFTVRTWIMYRNRGYLDNHDLNLQLAGGSYAFDTGLASSSPDSEHLLEGNVIGAEMMMPFFKNKYELNDPNMTRKTFLFGMSHNKLGSLPYNTIIGETVGRVVLQPATKQLLTKNCPDGQCELEINQGYITNIIDIRTGEWSLDVWRTSLGSFTRIPKPTTVTELPEEGLSLFREMFPVFETPGYGGTDPSSISPHAVEELGIAMPDLTNLDIDPSDSSIYIDPSTGDPITSGINYIHMSQTSSWYVSNTPSQDDTLIDVDVGGGVDITLGLCYSNHVQTEGISNYWYSSSPIRIARYDPSNFSAFSYISSVQAPPTAVVDIGLSYLAVDSPFTDLTVGTPVSRYSLFGFNEGTTVVTDIPSVTSFNIYTNPSSDYDVSRGNSRRYMCAEYDQYTIDPRDRFSLFGGKSYRSFFDTFSQDIIYIGEQINELLPDGGGSVPWCRWGFVNKGNLFFSSSISFLTSAGGEDEYIIDRFSGCYYPVMVSGSSSSDDELNTPSPASLNDMGARSNDGEYVADTYFLWRYLIDDHYYVDSEVRMLLK